MAILLFVACSDVKLSDRNDNSDDKVEVASITLTGSPDQTMESAGGKFTLSLTSTKAWTASSGQAWCKVSPMSGNKGASIVYIDVEANGTYDERNAKITFKSDTVTKVITVTQKQKDALLLSTNKIEVPRLATDIVLVVKSNVKYTYQIGSSAQSWISPTTISDTRGLSESSLYFHIKKNDGMKREGKIVIKSGNLSETVTVYQEGEEPSIVLSQDEYVVKSDGEEIAIQVKSNIEYDMIIPADADWIEKISTRAMSDYTHYLFVKPNDSYDSREAGIIFKSNDENLSDTVRIIQLQKDAILVAKSEYEIGAEKTKLSFDVSANIDFDVTTSVGWIRLAPKSMSLKDTTLVFDIDRNESFVDREGIITVSNGDISQRIKVIQLKNSVIVPAKDIYTLEAEATSLSFDVNTNVDFGVKVSVDWIRLNPKATALEEVTLTFDVEENTSYDDREGVITLYTDELEQNITVIQTGKEKDIKVIGITHSNVLFKAPILSGESFGATIDWGDNKIDNYVMSIEHQYSSQRSYTVKIETWGANEVLFESLKGVAEIDLSGFN
ncbi:MAG: BACON domain-containing protein [Bacteroidales bacterium]|nr:BACON domain-containing protein [Bacteroidales bacterium]